MLLFLDSETIPSREPALLASIEARYPEVSDADAPVAPDLEAIKSDKIKADAVARDLERLRSKATADRSRRPRSG